MRLVRLNMFKPCSFFFFCWPLQDGAFCGSILLFLYFMFICVMLYCLFLVVVWSPDWNVLTSWLSCVLCSLVYFCHFPTWCFGSVLDCIYSRPRGYKTWVQSQTQNKAQWLAACGHVSASRQSLRFILSICLPLALHKLWIWMKTETRIQTLALIDSPAWAFRGDFCAYMIST